jgi:hypothetical protein
LGQKSIIKENRVQGWERLARRQRYFQFINIFKRNWTRKTQYLPRIYGKTRK